MPDEGGYLGEKYYDELPEEMEIDEICLVFPDDQDVFDIEPELFLEYMREINTLRRVDGVIVRTDHIIQATISSARVGFTSFEEAITSYTFEGACIALVDPTKKEQIEKEITEKYLAKFPQYKNTFKVYFCKSDDGARFV